MTERNDFLTKYPGIYRCVDDISNLKIRVKIRKINENTENWNSVIITWQKKRFSRLEREFYSNSENCITENDKKLNSLLKDETEPDTETEFDVYCTIAENNENADEGSKYTNSEYDFERLLQKSLVTPLGDEIDSVEIKILADFGVYVENTWISNEVTLCELNYQKSLRILKVFPDFTDSATYRVNSEVEFQYQLENASNRDLDAEQTEKDLIQKITNHKLSVRNKIVLDSTTKFQKTITPHFHLFIELLYAKNFESSDIYVQYVIDLPSNWSGDGPLQGQTQLCRSKTKNSALIAHFGFNFDLELYSNDCSKQIAPIIYFHIVSRDSCDRFRTEGLTYQNLPLFHPGDYTYKLECFRFAPKSLVGELRRFFIGDCASFRNVKWVAPSTNAKVLNRFGVGTIGTGQLSLKICVLHQKPNYECENVENSNVINKLSCSTLIRSVEQVLAAFHRAKTRMIETREQFE